MEISQKQMTIIIYYLIKLELELKSKTESTYEYRLLQNIRTDKYYIRDNFGKLFYLKSITNAKIKDLIK